MLYVIGRIFSVLLILALKIAIDVLWFTISPVMGIFIILATLFLVYRTISFILHEKKERNFLKYNILSHMN